MILSLINKNLDQSDKDNNKNNKLNKSKLDFLNANVSLFNDFLL